MPTSRAARAEADEARARLAAIVESSADAIVSTDRTGKVLTWNPGAERLFGYTAGEMLGRSVFALAPPERQEEFPALWERVDSGEHVPPFEAVGVRKDGGIVYTSLAGGDERGILTGG